MHTILFREVKKEGRLAHRLLIPESHQRWVVRLAASRAAACAAGSVVPAALAAAAWIPFESEVWSAALFIDIVRF